jgi:hypothetical protein
MPRPSPQLVIDARPRGPGGPIASEAVLGRSLLGHLIELAVTVDGAAIVVHARPDEHRRLQSLVPDHAAGKVVFLPGPPPAGSAILRTDRLYDGRRLRRVLRRGRDPEAAVIWRLDTPRGLEGAEAELIRRQSYQPLGRFWALGPARLLARVLAPTRVRPNTLTLASAGLMLGASTTIALTPVLPGTRAAVAVALALALVLDTADGHLARLQGTATEFGRWLDGWLDELCDMTLHAAIAWAAFARKGAPGWLLAGMVYGMGKYVFMTGVMNWHGDGASAKTGLDSASTTAPLPVLAGWARSLARWAAHADVRWHLWIVLAGLGRLEAGLVAYALYFPVRSLVGAIRKGARHG